MKPIYLDKNGNSQKIVSGDPLDGTAIYEDYDPKNLSDSLTIATSGYQFNLGATTLRYFFSGLQVNPFSSEYFVAYKLQVIQVDGSFMDDSGGKYCSPNVILPVNHNHYRYNDPNIVNGVPTNPLFTTKEANPFNEDGSLKSGLVNEVQFFCANMGCAVNNIPMGLYAFFTSAIHDFLTENYPNAI